MRFRRLFSALLTITAVLALAACGSDEGGDSSDKRGAAVALEGGPATLAPADAPLYVEANVTPQGDQAAALDELVANISDGKTTDARAELVKALNKSLGKEDISFQRDIEPWLGSSAAVFATSLQARTSRNANAASSTLPGLGSLNTDPSDFEGAVVLETTDAGKTETFIDKISGSGGAEKSYEGARYKLSASEPVAAGIVEDKYLVVGNEQSFKQAVETAAGSSSLANDPTFQKAVKATPGGLVFGYVDSDGLKQSAKESAGSLGEQAQAFDMVFGQFEAIAFSAGVEDDAIKIDSAVIGGDLPVTAAGGLIKEMPAGAFAAFGAADIGDQGARFIEQLNELDPSGELDKQLQSMGFDLQRDVFSWMGDAAGYVEGDSLENLNAALVIETSDPAKTKALIAKIRPLLNLAEAAAGSSGDIKVQALTGSEADDGFKLTTSQIPFPVSIAVKDDRFVVALGNDALADAFGAKDKLGDSAAFEEAADQLDEGVEPMLYADVPRLLKLIENLAGDNAELDKVKPYLDAFEQISAGSKSGDDASTSQIVIGVKDRD